jgi:myo-inositol 2-dehydrogenase/D-chiro-inositol 1-dehydrogenase
MRIGIAGVGRIGAFHAQTLKSLDFVDSLVLADADPERAREVASGLDAEWVPTPDDLFSADLDGLVIATSTDAHAPMVIAAVDAGLPAFCEKPVAVDVAGTRAVLEKVDANDVPIHVGFQRRFDPGYIAARAAVRSGALGWIHTIRAGTYDPAPPPEEFIARSGGFFRDCSVHDFDAIAFVTGQRVRDVYATGANRGADFFGRLGDVDAASILLTLEDDTLCQVGGGRYNAAGYDVRLELLGSQSSVSAGLDENLPLYSSEADSTWKVGRPHANFMERFRPAYTAELTAFADLAKNGGTPACTVQDSLEALLVAEACEISRRERRVVSMDEVRS